MIVDKHHLPRCPPQPPFLLARESRPPFPPLSSAFMLMLWKNWISKQYNWFLWGAEKSPFLMVFLFTWIKSERGNQPADSLS